MWEAPRGMKPWILWVRRAAPDRQPILGRHGPSAARHGPSAARHAGAPILDRFRAAVRLLRTRFRSKTVALPASGPPTPSSRARCSAFALGGLLSGSSVAGRRRSVLVGSRSVIGRPSGVSRRSSFVCRSPVFPSQSAAERRLPVIRRSFVCRPLVRGRGALRRLRRAPRAAGADLPRPPAPRVAARSIAERAAPHELGHGSSMAATYRDRHSSAFC